MKYTLISAGIYNLVWGAYCVLFPYAFFDILSIARPNYIELWQCIGMIVGVYGIGYIIASNDPIKHWPITLVGFLGKLFGPIGFITSQINGSLPFSFGATIITNDVIWWLPFFYILKKAYEQRNNYEAHYHSTT